MSQVQISGGLDGQKAAETSLSGGKTGLNVVLLNGGSGGTSAVDETPFVAGTSAGTPLMAEDPTSGQLLILQTVAGTRSLSVSSSGGGGAATIADGADVTQGAIADAATVGDVGGTVSAKLRGLSKILNSVWSPGNSWLQVSFQNAVLAVTQSGAWVISAGAAIIGKVGIDQTTPGTTNGVQTLTGSTTVVTGSVTVAQATASNLLAQIGGLGAAAASVAGNPVRVGGVGRTTTPAAVTAGQLVDHLLDRLGRTFVVSPVTSRAASAGTPITTNTNTAAVAAPSAGNHLRIHRLWAQNSGAVATWCYWGNGSGDKTGPPFYLATGQPFSMAMEGRWELSSATGLFLNTATTGASIEWYAEYETLAD